MHLYQRKRAYTGLILSVLVFCAMLILFWSGFSRSARANSTQNLQVMRSAIQKAVVNCYAIEGVYPPDIEYLEDHYGIVLGNDKYVVHYELAGSNVMPSVEILERGTD